MVKTKIFLSDFFIFIEGPVASGLKITVVDGPINYKFFVISFSTRLSSLDPMTKIRNLSNLALFEKR